RRTLDAHQPKPGEADLRGFEWRYLSSICQGEQVAILSGHSNAVTSLDFPQDGRVLGSGSLDGTVRLWDFATRTQMTVTTVIKLGDRTSIGAVQFWLDNFDNPTSPQRVHDFEIAPARDLLAVAARGALHFY